MLYVKKGVFESLDRVEGWHTGETMPMVRGPVVSFQADGDELEVILAALRQAARKEPVVLEVTE